MAANIPDLGAVAHLGTQFHHNVFEGIHKNAKANQQKKMAVQATQARTAQQNRERFANSAQSTVQAGRKAYAQGVQKQQKQAASAAKAHAAGVKSGKVAPAPGAPPRTFAMGTSPQQKAQTKTMQQQKNFAHGQALTYQAAQFRVQQQQKNYAHGQAIQHQKQMNKQATKGGPVNTNTAPKAPSLSPSFSSTPTTHTSPVKPQGIASTSFSSQFTPQKPTSGPQGSATASFSSGSASHTTTPPAGRSGSVTGPQFPQHTHPEGSSTTPLPNLTASQPKPNTFTTGSRNAKPNGLAARGSQLESWAMQKQAEVRKQRGSDNTQLRLGD